MYFIIPIVNYCSADSVDREYSWLKLLAQHHFLISAVKRLLFCFSRTLKALAQGQF